MILLCYLSWVDSFHQVSWNTGPDSLSADTRSRCIDQRNAQSRSIFEGHFGHGHRDRSEQSFGSLASLARRRCRRQCRQPTVEDDQEYHQRFHCTSLKREARKYFHPLRLLSDE